eukprot:6177684-Pleurochrysis_carterae.AAC.6
MWGLAQRCRDEHTRVVTLKGHSTLMWIDSVAAISKAFHRAPWISPALRRCPVSCAPAKVAAPAPSWIIVPIPPTFFHILRPKPHEAGSASRNLRCPHHLLLAWYLSAHAQSAIAFRIPAAAPTTSQRSARWPTPKARIARMQPAGGCAARPSRVRVRARARARRWARSSVLATTRCC